MLEPPRYLLVVNHIVRNILTALDQIRQFDNYANLEILIITDRTEFNDKYSSYVKKENIIHCNFQDSKDIFEKLRPYKDAICGVICRGDRHIQYLRKIAPFLPPSVLVATPEALDSSTNKRLMRQSFQEHYPEITPNFLQVADASVESIARIEKKINYPLIIKPANLFSSLLIQVCDDSVQLKQSLSNVFEQIQAIYKSRDIHEKPQVIVEDFLKGHFFSIDAYVMEFGKVYCCPPVGYIPAKLIGVDDFFLYKRFIPTAQSDNQIKEANTAVTKALKAVNLTHSTAHVELVMTDDGWKIIEIGPRLGRFRYSMYKLAYNLDHSLNDIKIHLGIPPDIPDKLLQHCSAYSIYPTEEGVLNEIKGLSLLRNMEEVKNIKLYKNKGDECKFAKHGGGAILEFIITTDDVAKFNEATSLVEKEVYAEID